MPLVMQLVHVALLHLPDNHRAQGWKKAPTAQGFGAGPYRSGWTPSGPNN